MGFESCIVGQNNLTKLDAYKALAILKSHMRKNGTIVKKDSLEAGEIVDAVLKQEYFVKKAVWGEETVWQKGILTIAKKQMDFKIEELENKYKRIQKINVQLISPEKRDIFVNSNLDFMPIAGKMEGRLGIGTTRVFHGMTTMLTGKEAESGFQPSNIGSSEGILNQQVVFGEAGTPDKQDVLFHVDCLFEEGEGRSAKGIMEAHAVCDELTNVLRECLKKIVDAPDAERLISYKRYEKRPEIVLIKIASGLGNMYDTSVFPKEPAGFLESHSIRLSRNIPYVFSPTQVLDGVIHSLI